MRSFYPSSGDLHVMGTEDNWNGKWSFIAASLNLPSWPAGPSLRTEVVKRHDSRWQLPLTRGPIVPYLSILLQILGGNPFVSLDAERLLQAWPDAQPHSCEPTLRPLQLFLSALARLSLNLSQGITCSPILLGAPGSSYCRHRPSVRNTEKYPYPIPCVPSPAGEAL